MGSCLSSGNAELTPESKQGSINGTSRFEAVVFVSGPDPPAQAPTERSPDSSIPHAAADTILKSSAAVTTADVNVEVPVQPTAPVSSVTERANDDTPNPSVKADPTGPAGRPKASFAAADSRMSGMLVSSHFCWFELSFITVLFLQCTPIPWTLSQRQNLACPFCPRTPSCIRQQQR
jgi:hypothetical protein